MGLQQHIHRARYCQRDNFFSSQEANLLSEVQEKTASLFRAPSFSSCHIHKSLLVGTEPMGRGRGRGRKLTNGRTHEDKGSSGEEVIVPARKRRGRPQKRVAEKINQAEVKNLEEVDDGDEDYQVGAGDDAKLKVSRAENLSAGTGNKRNRVPKEEEGSNVDMEENSSSTRSSNDESTKSNGFRQVGSRRKSTPRRAAEAGFNMERPFAKPGVSKNKGKLKYEYMAI
ncbi:hypothetical protein EJB05_45005, partial [Eragrostis curvula]